MTRTGFGVQWKTSFITVFYPKDRAADRVGRAAGTALFVRNERCGASGRALGGASHLTASLVPPGPTEVSGDVEQAWESRPGNARGRSSCPWKTQRGLSNRRPNRGEGSRGSPTQTCIKNKKRGPECEWRPRHGNNQDRLLRGQQVVAQMGVAPRNQPESVPGGGGHLRSRRPARAGNPQTRERIATRRSLGRKLQIGDTGSLSRMNGDDFKHGSVSRVRDPPCAMKGR